MNNKDGSYIIRIIPEPYRIETVEFEPMNQFLQDILLSLTRKQDLTRSCKIFVQARSGKSFLQDLTSTLKTLLWQDLASESYKYLQDPALARSSTSHLQALVKFSKILSWLDKARYMF